MSTQLNQLDPQKRRLTLIGLCALMFFVTASSATLLSFQTLLLEKLDAQSAFSLATITTSIGLAIMTPIGGKLGDILGRKKVLIYSAALGFICMFMIAFAPNATVYLIARTFLGLIQGAFISAPYVLVSVMYERQQVPKYMGYLASSMAIGSFIGPSLAGAINDAGSLELALAFPGFFLIIAIICVMYGLPDLQGRKDVTLDIPGIILLTVAMVSFVLTSNYMPRLGISHPYIFTGIAILLVSILVFWHVEKKVEASGRSPIIPVRLLKNKEYAALLAIGVACYFYQVPSVPYRAQIVFDIIGSESASIVGMLSMPRSVITMLTASFIGVWIAKKYTNQWKAMALASGLVALAFVPLIYVSPQLPIFIFFINSAITGFAEAFRAVSITPAAQDTLSPEDFSSGTALINFFNTLASVLAGATSGFVYNMGLPNVAQGISNVFILVVAVSIAGFLLTVLYIRPKHIQRAQAKLDLED